MNNKLLIVLAVLLAAFGTVFAVQGATVTVTGFGPHIGTAGVINTNHGHGFCVDAYNHRTDPQTYKTIPNTNWMPKNNYVKQLIVTYYKPGMSSVSARNLQYAIWYFTNGVPALNNQVKNMINQVKAHPKVIPDATIKLISHKVVLTGVSYTNKITLLKTNIISSDAISYLGNTTAVSTVKNCKNITITTTITSFYQKVTTTVTTFTYQNTTTKALHYKTTDIYSVLNFTSYKGNLKVQGKKQSLIFFQTTTKTKVSQSVKYQNSSKIFTETKTDQKTEFFNTTTTKVVVVKCPHIIVKKCHPVKCNPKPPCKPPICKHKCHC